MRDTCMRRDSFIRRRQIPQQFCSQAGRAWPEWYTCKADIQMFGPMECLRTHLHIDWKHVGLQRFLHWTLVVNGLCRYPPVAFIFSCLLSAQREKLETQLRLTSMLSQSGLTLAGKAEDFHTGLQVVSCHCFDGLTCTSLIIVCVISGVPICCQRFVGSRRLTHFVQALKTLSGSSFCWWL